MIKTKRVGKKIITIHYPKVNSQSQNYKIDLIKALNWFSTYEDRDLISEALIATKQTPNIHKFIKSLKNLETKLRQFCMYHILLSSGSTFNDNHNKYFNNIFESLSHAKIPPKKKTQSQNEENTTKKPSVQDNIKAKADIILAEIDNAIDEFITHSKQLPTINQIFKYNKITPQMQGKFTETYTPLINELNSDNEQCVEAYSFLSKKQKKTIITFIKDLIDHFKQIKVIRAPRVKKPQPPSKLVKNIKLADIGKWHGFTFQKKYPATEIINSEILVFWIEQKRRLVIMNALPDSKLTVQGTTIKNVDLKNSFYITLRFPEEILSNDLQTMKKRALNNLLMKLRKTPLTTTRVNNNMFLVNII